MPGRAQGDGTLPRATAPLLLPPQAEPRTVGRTAGGEPLTLDVLTEALGRVYSGDQSLEADALADVFEDMHLFLWRRPDYIYRGRKYG